MRKAARIGLGIGVILAALAGTSARAGVKPNNLFTDGAVLQRGVKVPVWGTARNGEAITVSFQGQELSTTAREGKWRVDLAPLEAGGPWPMTIRGDYTIEIKNVWVGEVWICSGQSNMEWPVRNSADAEATIEGANDPRLRLFTVPRQATDEPRRDVEANWVPTRPETVRGFSAVAYSFGRELRKELKVPVGLINTSFGGTPAEAWTSRPALEADSDFKDILEHPGRNQNRPAGLYNAMIAPLVPYAFQGAIWYQGESNANRAAQYRKLFPAMIKDWRTAWGQGDFPFLFVQLAPFMKIQEEPKDSAWAELREAQSLTLTASPRTGMAVITDLGDERDIHPKQKAPVGARLALAARALAYGQDLVYSGPVFDELKVEGDKAALSFKHLGGGLVAKDGDLKGFAIAGKDGKFHNARAEIQGDKVVVSSPEVSEPAAVRFGWADYPVVNLYNKEGLPASPFRTDRPEK
jgi:sialate O-acetylesterase